MKSFFKALDHRVTVAYADHCGEDPFIFCINNARYNDAETHYASIPYFRLHNVERVVGENALTERAEACGIDLTRFAGRKPLYCDIGAMAEDGDAHAKELIKDLAVDLSFAISNLITLFNPSLVVIGGMGVNLGPFFLSNIRDEVQNSGFKEFVSNTLIQYSTLGLDSELGGAARYYIDHYYDFFEQMQGGLYAD